MEERVRERKRKIVDVMCCDVVADRPSHGVPASRVLYYRPYPRCCRRQGGWRLDACSDVGSVGGEDKKRLFA